MKLTSDLSLNQAKRRLQIVPLLQMVLRGGLSGLQVEQIDVSSRITMDRIKKIPEER